MELEVCAYSPETPGTVTDIYKHDHTTNALALESLISKIRVAIRKAKQIQPAQFQYAANKAFKVNVKEDKAIYQSLTGETSQHWVTTTNLS
ncbi:12991_t:CDS:2 [Ambispora leptoticha]|uniref:12991_t:CDS:1 n=1 Tax=Ambispora leptoticha TaxID=144679 RepID=A0A9N8W7G4_9GLOM|nr:12991_t:CDS:2 [Ambispora leptoticha]